MTTKDRLEFYCGHTNFDSMDDRVKELTRMAFFIGVFSACCLVREGELLADLDAESTTEINKIISRTEKPK